MEIGVKINKLRREKKMSAEKLAELIGLSSAPAIYSYESGRTKPSIDKIKEIADIFGVPITYFTESENITTSNTENPYKDVLFIEMKQEIDFLREMLRNLTAGKQIANFLNASDVAPTVLKLIRGVESGVKAA